MAVNESTSPLIEVYTDSVDGDASLGRAADDILDMESVAGIVADVTGSRRPPNRPSRGDRGPHSYIDDRAVYRPLCRKHGVKPVMLPLQADKVAFLGRRMHRLWGIEEDPKWANLVRPRRCD